MWFNIRNTSICDDEAKFITEFSSKAISSPKSPRAANASLNNEKKDLSMWTCFHTWKPSQEPYELFCKEKRKKRCMYRRIWLISLCSEEINMQVRSLVWWLWRKAHAMQWRRFKGLRRWADRHLWGGLFKLWEEKREKYRKRNMMYCTVLYWKCPHI